MWSSGRSSFCRNCSFVIVPCLPLCCWSFRYVCPPGVVPPCGLRTHLILFCFIFLYLSAGYPVFPYGCVSLTQSCAVTRAGYFPFALEHQASGRAWRARCGWVAGPATRFFPRKGEFRALWGRRRLPSAAPPGLSTAPPAFWLAVHGVQSLREAVERGGAGCAA